MRKRFILAAGALFWIFPAAAAVAQDPFAANVRPTEPLSPEQELKSFALPPGFEIQLFAAEPDILKPLNMAFDAQGRLWITESTEYPYPAAAGTQGRDNIKILADTTGDGRADRITTFADGLNIPIGLYPFHDGCIAFSIPHIWKFEDHDGDGRADHREKLYGPMGFDRDTHGLNNAFRRGFDGWLYACHGFNNQTTVKGGDGHQISMQSGNTYRMRIDGSRIEQFTWGQVNPFGMTFDPLGNIFTADCHSKPLTQLLRGGYYPSFGKPHDGLGFVAPMMNHLHGSTAIAGAAFYAAEQFPAAYRGNIFTGNVMTGRVNRDSLEYRGSTIIARQEPDFVTTSDPWFRPVDVQVGPDGAVYVADFYNRIIGHYEVPLDHPGRDRHRGRIWRIAYTGGDKKSVSLAEFDLSNASADRLTAALESENLTVRMLATSQLTDRIGRPAVEAARQAFSQSPSKHARSHALWVLHRLGALDIEQIRTATNDASRQTRVHAIRVLAETADWSDVHRELALAALRDGDAFVRQAAADALARHPRSENAQPLLAALLETPAKDTHRRHAIRMALRDQMLLDGALVQVGQSDLSVAESREIASIALAVNTAEAGSYLARYVEASSESGPQLRACLTHAARYAPPQDAERLAAVVQQRFAANLDVQWELFDSISNGLAQRGVQPGKSVVDWAGRLAGKLLDSTGGDSPVWTNTPVQGAVSTENPWVLQQRVSADGDRDSVFLCSLPRGEQLTGVLRSREFSVPERLRFYLAGHIGPPNRPVNAQNFVRLRQADTHNLLAETRPPRNDTAQLSEWDLKQHAGKRAYLELVDGDQRRAYAWLAVGRFDPPVIAAPTLSPHLVAQRQQAAAAIVGRLKLESHAPRLTELMLSPMGDIAARGAAARALVSLHPDTRIDSLAAIVGDASLDVRLRDKICRAIASRETAQLTEVLAESLQSAPRRIQESLAAQLAGNRAGAEMLLDLVEQGKAAPRLLTSQSLKTRLEASMLKDAAARIASLTANLPPASETTQKLLTERRAAHAGRVVSLARGAEVFAKQCAACHQLDGKGPLIGPQLDGIGNRGLERLLEDLLDPNRNVDVAFLTTTIVTIDGKVLSGLLRREEGATLVFVDQQGKEFRVAKDDVEESSKSRISLMPENIARTIAESDFHHLLGFLLSKRGAAQSKEE